MTEGLHLLIMYYLIDCVSLAELLRQAGVDMYRAKQAYR